MALNSLIPDAWGPIMEQMARETLERELAYVLEPDPFTPVSEASRTRAKEIVDKIVADGRLFEVLEVTAAQPCPTCGHIP